MTIVGLPVCGHPARDPLADLDPERRDVLALLARGPARRSAPGAPRPPSASTRPPRGSAAGSCAMISSMTFRGSRIELAVFTMSVRIARRLAVRAQARAPRRAPARSRPARAAPRGGPAPRPPAGRPGARTRGGNRSPGVGDRRSARGVGRSERLPTGRAGAALAQRLQARAARGPQLHEGAVEGREASGGAVAAREERVARGRDAPLG